MCFENALQEQEPTVWSIMASEDVVPYETPHHITGRLQNGIFCAWNTFLLYDFM